MTWHHVGLAAVRLTDRSTTVTADEAVLPDWRRSDTVVRTDKSESPFLPKDGIACQRSLALLLMPNQFYGAGGATLVEPEIEYSID